MVPNSIDEISRAAQHLAVAEEKLQRIVTSRRRGDEYHAALEDVAANQRKLAAAKGEEYAEPFDLGFQPESAVPAPVVLETDTAAFLTFRAVRLAADGKYDRAGFAVVEIQQFEQTKFGYPNDEALGGHPLYKKGLGPYGIFEVRNARWPQLLAEQNRVNFPETPASAARHFIFTFHDSTLECVAARLTASLHPGPYSEILIELARKAKLLD